MTLKSMEEETQDDVVLNLSEEMEAAARGARHASLDLAVQTLLNPVKELLGKMEEWASTNVATADRAETDELRRALEKLPQQLESMGQTVLTGVGKRLDGLAAMMAEFHQEMQTHLEDLPRAAEPELARAATAGAGDEDRWERALFGEELCQNPELATIRQDLLEEMLSGVGEARALAGQMMLVQSASAEQMPELLKSVGQAYYRWRPRTGAGDEPLERALVSWLTKRAEAVGLRNKIQLVHPGSRFDATRHLAAERGVEIVAVHGWVVLRNNGKVYTKANVSVK